MISATRYTAAAEIRRQTNLAKDIAKLQTSVSSNKRITVGSDDPTASGRVSDIRLTQANQLIWSRNADTGASIAATADDTLKAVGTLLDRAKDLVLAGRNDTASDNDRTAIATELRGLANDIATYSQQKDPTGRPLFPTDSVIRIPVSDTLALPATGLRDTVFTATTAAGAQSISDILNAAAASLEEPDGALRAAAIDASITAIDDGSNHIGVARADQGIRAQRFDAAKEMLDTDGDALTEERQALEQTDLTYALSEFQAKQLSLQAAQTLFAQTSKTSLFNLLG
jgi:flagellar hook-associated protein 3 FlgL